MSAFGFNDIENQNRQIVLNGRDILERTSESLARTTRVAIETEQIGTNVINDLDEQRETLLRANARLDNANVGLDESRNVLKRMSREVLYNKIILIAIIFFESFILLALLYIKLFRRYILFCN